MNTEIDNYLQSKVNKNYSNRYTNNSLTRKDLDFVKGSKVTKYTPPKVGIHKDIGKCRVLGIAKDIVSFYLINIQGSKFWVEVEEVTIINKC